MNVAVFGLGYIGCITVACLARVGHRTIGVDVNVEKVQKINTGVSPVKEPGLSIMIGEAARVGRLEATYDSAYAVRQSEVVLVCVGTPSNQDGSINLKHIERVCQEIGQALRHKSSYTVIAVRSTILPGIASEHLLPILQRESEKEAGDAFGFCVNPEFLREGNGIADFENPPYTIIGQLDQKSGDHLARLYSSIAAPLYQVPLGTAEMIKYASNSFHALKVVFANEIGNLCQLYGVDSHEVMEIFAEDTESNISSRYLKPGYAFGGSCLPKDLRALLHSARQHSLQVPVLESVLPSNKLQVDKALQMIQANGNRKVGLIGLSFKADTDDLRESPAVELAERLIGEGFELTIFDRNVSFGQIYGVNRDYIEKAIPNLASCLKPSLQETIRTSEVIVVTKQPSDEECKIMTETLRSDHSLLDLVRLDAKKIERFNGNYLGIAW